MPDLSPRRVRPWEALHAWQHAHKLFLAIHRAAAKWPAQERYALGAQIRRSAFSVPANIAEGHAKKGPGEFRKSLDVSLGSLAEVQYTLHAAHDLGIIDVEEWRALDLLSDEAGRCLWGLYRSGPKGRAGG
ncbi:MAG: four helix bundle protein [Gemmatimonadales bacterium]